MFLRNVGCISTDYTASHPRRFIFFGSPCYLHHAGFLLGFSSTLKTEASCSSETSVNIQRTTGLYIPEDGTLQINILFNGGFY
jgi:hypothetical protein